MLPKLPPCQCNSNILKGIPLFETQLITNTIQPQEVKKRNNHKSEEGHVAKETVMLHQWGNITG